MSVILNEPGIRAFFFGPEMRAYLQVKTFDVAHKLQTDPVFGIDTILGRVAEGDRPAAIPRVVVGENSLVGTVSWDSSRKFGQYLEEKSKKEPDKLVGGAMVAAGFQRV